MDWDDANEEVKNATGGAWFESLRWTNEGGERR
jgi:hypothetical protein